MTSVPSHSPYMLASAGMGNLPRHVHGIGQSLSGNDDLGSDDMFVSPADFLTGEKGEAPTPAAHIFDVAKACHENLRYAEHFQEFLPFAHAGDLHIRPREDLLVGAHREADASDTIHRYTSDNPHGFLLVNPPCAARSFECEAAA